MANNLLPVFQDANGQRPMTANDRIEVRVVPVSTQAGNTLQTRGDGLYAGSGLTTSVMYVAAAGVDQPANGSTKEAPYKTLSYALAQLTSLSGPQGFRGVMTIALKAGEQFDMSSDFDNYGMLTVSYYDSIYGDWDSPLVDGATEGALMSDLNRPVINVASTNANSIYNSFGIRMFRGSMLDLRGLRINLAERPTAQPPITQYGGYSDFVTAAQSGRCDVNVFGSLFNQRSEGYFGFLGIWARSNVSLTEFGSQLLIDGLLLGAVGTAPTTIQLNARQYHIKFYADRASNNRFVPLSASSANSSTGTGLLHLCWSEAQALPVGTRPAPTLATWPVLGDVGSGLRNYFMGLTRDLQQRPMNVISGRLF